ncbi:UNVERIFIED_CONTAM: Plasmodesmata-located protein 5 [Sesamum latifolium]|uniref:Plasmodesmata-located protein 5 n=1 Tax=Sesamum latifolium TaxID=2727402 RepID=A0AAW2TCE4_9LAMI
MDSSTNSCTLILCFVLILQSVNTLIIDGHHKLIYNQCSNQSTSLNPSRSSLLSALFQEFIAHSSQSRFFQTIVADDETTISGRFQCRNDLNPDECRSCVSNFQALSENLCGKNLPARIQLSGCYVHYQEEDGAEADPGPDRVLHQACSKHRIKKNGFEEKYAALAALESCVVSGNGFCETTCEVIHVVGQCAGVCGLVTVAHALTVRPGLLRRNAYIQFLEKYIWMAALSAMNTMEAMALEVTHLKV